MHKQPAERFEYTMIEELVATEVLDVPEKVSREESDVAMIEDKQIAQDMLKSNLVIDLNESPKSENVAGNFEVDDREFRNWILREIETTNHVYWFENNYIRKNVTNLGGEVLRKFIEKLKELKRKEAKGKSMRN